MTPCVLGIDPGHKGAAILLRGSRVLAAAHWRPAERDGVPHYLLRTAHRNRGGAAVGSPMSGDWVARRARPRSPHQLGVEILGKWRLFGGPWRIAFEDVYLGRNPQTALHLIRWSGMVAGPLNEYGRGGVKWVGSGTWRKASFRKQWWAMQAIKAGMVANKKTAAREGVPFMPKRDAAKREAAEVMPLHFPELNVIVGEIAGREHVFDAAGIARWLEVNDER